MNAVMHRAFDELLERLEKERLGKSSRPQKNPKPTTTEEIPAAVRREVFERDGEQCTFVSEDGHRCESRSFLELDHIDERALGGAATSTNLRVVCRAHNRFYAEQTFGKAHIESKIRERREAMAVLDQARNGLLNLGFRKDEVAKTLTTLANRHAQLPPIADFLREALAALT